VTYHQGMVTLTIWLDPTPGTVSPPHVLGLLQRWYPWGGVGQGGALGLVLVCEGHGVCHRHRHRPHQQTHRHC